jgi:maltooligosyltrehalose synthase
MPSWLITVLSAAGSVVLTLTVTLLFNKLVALPKEIKKQREAEAAAQAAKEAAHAEREAELQSEINNLRRELENKEAEHLREDQLRDARIAALQAAVDALPSYRAQSLQIQTQLQTTDREILSACEAIQRGVADNQHVLNERLDRLEKREKNALRQKILQEHRLFADEATNPMRAWTEMEHHSFFELVRDYEDLGGNDYVHSDVLPDMNRLRVVPMSDRNTLCELMNSRRL